MAVDKKTLKCNKPRRTPKHKTKSHVVKACSAGKKKLLDLDSKVFLQLVNQRKMSQLSKRLDVKVLKLDTLKTLLKVKCQLHTGQIK